MTQSPTFSEASKSKRAHKRWVARAFDATPASYGFGGDFHERFAQRLVETANLKLGQSVLDVATCTAPAAIAAALAVGSSGYVCGIDISAGILRSGVERLAQTGANNVALCLGDGEHLPFANATFDAVLCSSSLAWFLDIPSALAEWRRALKPGGRVAFSCFAQSANTAARLLRAHLRQFGVVVPDLNAPLDTPAKCVALLERAGFTSCEIGSEQWGSWLHDAEDIFQRTWIGNRARFGFDLPRAEFDALKSAYVAEVRKAMTDQGFWNDMTAFFVRASK